MASCCVPLGVAGAAWPAPRRRGLAGDATTAVVMQAPQIVGATVGVASALHASWATAAIPFVGPIVAGVTIALSALMARKGPKQKVATTKIVEDVEPLLIDNLNGYLNGPRTRSSQLQALANFDAAWEAVLSACGQASMGNPGQACINDRKRGACHYRDAGGQCWNWFAGYRDPIANDTQVVADPIAPAGGAAGDLLNVVFGGGGGAADSPAPSWPLLLGAGLILWAVVS